MARIAGCAGLIGLAVALGGLVGCGPSKELPDEPPPQHDPQGKGTQPQVPAASEDAAKKVYEQHVQAVTGGKPELRAKAKTCRVLAKGDFIMMANGGIAPDTERTLATVWPNRMTWLYVLPKAGNKSLQTWFLDDKTDVYENGRPQRFADDSPTGARAPSPADLAEIRRIVTANLYAQHWFPLAIPALDSKAPGEPRVVAYQHQTPPAAEKPLDLIKVAVNDLPVYTLAFDPKTHLLQRVEFTIAEFNKQVRMTILFEDHKPVEGLTLPFKITTVRGPSPVERWTVTGWEFPRAIDDKEFRPPPE